MSADLARLLEAGYAGGLDSLEQRCALEVVLEPRLAAGNG